MKIDNKREFRPGPSQISSEAGVERYLDNRATQERLCKGNEFLVVDGVHRLCGPVSALRRAGDINDSHVTAADRWYRDYVLGVEGARDPESARSGKAPDAHSGMLSRVAACGRYRSVREALGFCAEVRLRLLLIDELSFSAMAIKLMPNDTNGRKKVAAQMAFILEQLAEHYYSVDRYTNLTKP